MTMETVQKGSRQAIITSNDGTGPFWTRLYVNHGETATLLHKTAQTLKGARKQAEAMLRD